MKEAGIGCFVFVIAVGVVLGLVVVVNNIECGALSRNTGHPTRFVLFGGGEDGCLIYDNSQWLPTDKWRVVAD